MREFSFNVEAAKRYGVDEAILMQNIAFWVEKNRANGKHFHDGRYWTYNTQQAMAELFPFWTEKQIRRIVASCQNQHAILIGNYNVDPMDHTTWYALNDDAATLFYPDDKKGTSNRPNGHIESPKWADDYNEQIVNITDIPPIIPPQGEGAPQPTEMQVAETYGFDRFWSAYPRKVDKQKAQRSWKRLKPDVDLVIDILRALEVWKRCRQWQDPQYIPHPSTWLNNRRWEVSPDGVYPAAPEPAPRDVEEWT